MNRVGTTLTASAGSSALRVARAAALALGAALMAIALFGPLIGLGSSGQIGMTRLLGLFLGCVSIAVGIAGPRFPRLYRATSIVMFNTVVLLLVLEMGSALLLHVRSSPTREPGEPVQATAPYYRSREWSDQYWAEHEALFAQGVKYRPYVVTGWGPFNGQMIGVDEMGYRRTPGSECGEGSYQVFFFGGSTAWGYGAPDWGTIPAYLREGLATALGRPVCMRNLGQLGFVSTQNLIQLMRELHQGYLPDLVVFYGGNNDIAGADQTGEAGAHWGMTRTAQILEAAEPGRVPELSELRWRSNLYRLVEGMLRRGEAQPLPEWPHHVSDTLAENVVRVYLTNHRIADALGRAYGFTVETFWQPHIVGDPKTLTTEELRFRKEAAGSLEELVMPKVRVEFGGKPHLHDLWNIFAGRQEQIFVDTHHITPEGNRIVAMAMMEAFRRSGTMAALPRTRRWSPSVNPGS